MASAFLTLIHDGDSCWSGGNNGGSADNTLCIMALFITGNVTSIAVLM